MAGISGTFAWWTEGKMSGNATADGIDFLTDNVAVLLYPSAPTTSDVTAAILENGGNIDVEDLNIATGGSVNDATHSELIDTSKTVGTIPYTFDAADTTVALAATHAETKNLVIVIQAGGEGTIATTDLLIAHIELGAGNYITPNNLDVLIQWDSLGIVKVGAHA